MSFKRVFFSYYQSWMFVFTLTKMISLNRNFFVFYHRVVFFFTFSIFQSNQPIIISQIENKFQLIQTILLLLVAVREVQPGCRTWHWAATNLGSKRWAAALMWVFFNIHCGTCFWKGNGRLSKFRFFTWYFKKRFLPISVCFHTQRGIRTDLFYWLNNSWPFIKWLNESIAIDRQVLAVGLCLGVGWGANPVCDMTMTK